MYLGASGKNSLEVKVYPNTCNQYIQMNILILEVYIRILMEKVRAL